MRNFMLCLVLCLASGCGLGRDIQWLVTGEIPDYPPETPLTAAEWAIVNRVEARVPGAAAQFGYPGFMAYRPRITVIRDPQQVVRGYYAAWVEVPRWAGTPAREPADGYSGLYRGPDLYVSRIGWRDTDEIFEDLYCQERAHAFNSPERPIGEGAVYWGIVNYLRAKE